MLKLNVCIGSACHIKGSQQVIQSFQRMIEEKGLQDAIELCAAFCRGHCVDAVSVTLGEDEEKVYSVSGDTAAEFFETQVMPRLEDRA